MPTCLTHSLEIACSPERLYDYVTQPWRWHEWHPASVSARASTERLAEGDCFDEIIELHPLAPLPLRLRRQTSYRVIESSPPLGWQVRGETRDGWLEIDYRLEPVAGGTRFTRGLTYQAHGPTRLLMALIGPRIARQSQLALDNLKRRMEFEIPE